MTDTPLITLRFSLPWPPSVNTYWTHAVMGGKWKKACARVLLSNAGRAYRVAALAAIQQQQVPRGAVKGRLAVKAVAYPPDRRARDLDNLWKGVLDSLKHAGVIVDDGDIDDLHIVRSTYTHQRGELHLTIAELGEFNEQAAINFGDGARCAGIAAAPSHEGTDRATAPPPF